MTELAQLIRTGMVTEADTAFIVVDFQWLHGRLEELKQAFPSRTQHAIAIKTQPIRSVLSWLVKQGFALEAASIEEVQLALASGAKAEQLVFDSPVKTRAEIAWCEKHGSGMMVNANGLAELHRMSPSTTLRWGLRVNPGLSSAPDAAFDVSAPGSKFGVSLDDRASILEAFRQWPLTGIHVHVGSGADEMGLHRDAILRVLDLAREIDEDRQARGGEKLTFVDVGGGVASDVPGEGLQFLGKEIDSAVLPHWEVWTEFGQWVHAGGGRTYSRVEYVELPVANLPGKAFVHLGADFFTRQVYHRRRQLNVTVLGKGGESVQRPELRHQIFGPLCFAGDILTAPEMSPMPEEGDWIQFDKTGANTYGLWSRHCSRSLPKVIGKDVHGDFHILQARQSIPF